eukprot:UC1_evm1s986
MNSSGHEPLLESDVGVLGEYELQVGDDQQQSSTTSTSTSSGKRAPGFYTGQKRKHYYFNSRKHINLVARILIMAISIFGLVQLSSIPLGCENQSCLAAYIRNGDGKVPPSSLLQTPCSAQRLSCFNGEAYDFIGPKAAQSPAVPEDYALLADRFDVFIDYCKCLINMDKGKSNQGYCPLEGMRSLIFGYGMLTFLLIALTSNSPFKRRILALGHAHVYFCVLLIILSTYDPCQSALYRSKVSLLVSLLIASEAVMVLLTVLECLKMLRLTRAGASEWV